MKQVAFIAGATGYTGRAVVAACVAEGITTYAHVRPDSPTLASWQDRFAKVGARVDTTAWQPDAMAQTLQQVQPTQVFALLGTTRKRAKREQLSRPYATVDAGLTLLLIDACKTLALPPRFIYLSAMGVRDVPNAYIQARWQVEQRLRQSTLPYVIARPGLIAGDRKEKRLAEQAAYVCMHTTSRLLNAVGARSWANTLRPLTGTRLAHALTRIAIAPPADPLVKADALAALAYQDA